MKKTLIPLLFALVFIYGCAGNRDFIKHPDSEFIAKNQNTAYLPLSRTVEYVNQEKGVLSGENPKAADIPGFDAAIEKSLDRTGVWKIKISSITGKRKKYDSDGNEMKFGRMEQNRR